MTMTQHQLEKRRGYAVPSHVESYVQQVEAAYRNETELLTGQGWENRVTPEPTQDPRCCLQAIAIMVGYVAGETDSLVLENFCGTFITFLTTVARWIAVYQQITRERDELLKKQERWEEQRKEMRREVKELRRRLGEVEGAPPKRSKYVSCKVCHKKIAISIRKEHLRRHQETPSKHVMPPQPPEEPKKCSKCQSNIASPNPDSQTRESRQDLDGELRAICPICDVELDSAALEQHVAAHYTPASDNQAGQGSISIALCASCGDEFKLQHSESTNKRKRCR